ncbi:probable E3 ubiquitin-protein ligase RHY1A [Phalaenopsis equestris]|uniref:probable E3 ubiquitin-protein ligase RHY1A n=1 Tax=Phalaenopsis equestris TaxID=78828 RepID=UPI0009E29C85|nr:probable E3 ubiquitin-protein ligase RHY1A [Phalaenopsis equestris]
MTIALQLLCVLRPPSRRNQRSVAEVESDDLDLNHDARRSRRDRHRGHRREDGDHAQRSHGGASKGRLIRTCGSHLDRELGTSSRNGREGYYPGNSSNARVSNTMLTHLGLTRNDQLPRPVEEARLRLVERLRSVSLTDNRQRAPNAHVPYNEPALGDVFNIYNVNLTPNIVNTESTISIKKKIPPHRWDAFCAAKGETFRNPEEKYEDGVMAAPTECCICLEGFREGDKLIKLRCSHKFHPGCLEPWVRSSAVCPLCRANITEI